MSSMTAPGFWKYAGAPTPPPPPPPPAGRPAVVFDFDFEAADVENYDVAHPNDQYATTNFDGYYVTWTGNSVAQNAEYTGLLPEEQPGYRAVLGLNPSLAVNPVPMPATRFDVNTPFNRQYFRMSFLYLGSVEGGLKATDGTWIGTFQLALTLGEQWNFYDSGWNQVDSGKLFSHFECQRNNSFSFGLWFLDNIRIEFSDNPPPP